MQINATTEDFITWIAEALRAQFSHNDGLYTLELGNPNIIRGGVDVASSTIQNLATNLAAMEETEDTAIHDRRCYEVLVREESSGLRLPLRLRTGNEVLTWRDDENGMRYTVAKPSDEYEMFLLFKASKIGPIQYTFDVQPPRMQRLLFELEQGDIPRNVFDVLRSALPRFLTLRLESDRDRTITEFTKYATAFFFQISYNMDVALVAQRHWDELARTSRITRHRRSGPNELEPPKRFYTPDLIHHYQLGVGSDSPSLEFLSYYHVAEHFFEEVFQEDLIERVKNKITQPDFSYKRKKDVKDLIGIVSTSIKFREEDMTFSEQEALRLTLHRYVNVSDLLVKLKEYDASLVEYYRDTQVSFSSGIRVDLESDDVGAVAKALAYRIYSTRNAIVHSKEGKKGRYIPFTHDKQLVKEIPLVRFISELIIINSSTIIS